MVKKVSGSIMFTDIVSSSKLWKKNYKKMLKALLSHEKRMYKLVKKYKGCVVKTIGDSFMLYFKNYKNAINCAIDVQRDLIKKPLKIGSSKLKLRIGICHGNFIRQNIVYQGKKLKDYLGPAVNIASRMESKASKEGEIAFAFIKNSLSNEQQLLDFFTKRKCKVHIRNFTKSCNIREKKRTRSSRLIYGYKCLNPKLLKGVGNVKAYIVKV